MIDARFIAVLLALLFGGSAMAAWWQTASSDSKLPPTLLLNAAYAGNSSVEFVDGDDSCLGTGRVTYLNTIEPIMERNCHQCHAGDYEVERSGPWSHLSQGDLSSWDAVHPRIASICREVARRTMPPHTEPPLDDAEYARFMHWCDRAGYVNYFLDPTAGSIDAETVADLVQSTDAQCMTCHARSTADQVARGTCASVMFDEGITDYETTCSFVAQREMPLTAEHATIAESFGCTPARPLDVHTYDAFAEACGDEVDWGFERPGETSDLGRGSRLRGYPVPVLEVDVSRSNDGDSAHAWQLSIRADFGQPFAIPAISTHHPDQYRIAVFYDEDHHGFDGQRIRMPCMTAEYREVSSRYGHSRELQLEELPIGPERPFIYLYACMADADNVYCAYHDSPLGWEPSRRSGPRSRITW